MNLTATYIRLTSKIVAKTFVIEDAESSKEIIERIKSVTITKYWTQPVERQTLYFGIFESRYFCIRKMTRINTDFGYSVLGRTQGDTLLVTIVPGTPSTALIDLSGLVVFGIFANTVFAGISTTMLIVPLAILLGAIFALYSSARKYPDEFCEKFLKHIDHSKAT